jgi:4-diphosphocytidyl-2-C-methyl-D-erythritol kinase
MIVKAHAKINLALDILSKDPGGYHLIKTVYQKIPLFDEIEIKKGEPIVQLKGNESGIIDPNNNTVTKALELAGGPEYSVTVHKNIPLGAGLGGGSSDAAAILKTLKAGSDLAVKVGMDVPFFLNGETAAGKHFGEEIDPLPPLSANDEWRKLNKILVIPQLRKSTKKMYEKVDTSLTAKNKNQTENLIKAVKEGDIDGILKNIHNDFEIFAGTGFKRIKKTLTEKGADKVLLCGSGTAVIGFSKNPFDAEELCRELPHQRILNLTP